MKNLKIIAKNLQFGITSIKFSIVDQITYEGHSVQSIDFCPFCGEKIDYEDENKPQKVKKKTSPL